jgi:hypothetical protein
MPLLTKSMPMPLKLSGSAAQLLPDHSPHALWILCIPIVGLDLHLSMAVGHFFCIFGSLAVGIANDSAHIQ